MKRAKKPGFVLYIDDFRGGTCAMSAAEVGDYIRLLCDLYDQGGRIEFNRDKLRHVFKCRPQDVEKRLQRLVDLGKLSTDKDGFIHNGRVDREFENIEENGVDEAQMTFKWRANEASAQGKKSTKSRPRARASSKPSHITTNVVIDGAKRRLAREARAPKTKPKNPMIEAIGRMRSALRDQEDANGSEYLLLSPISRP